MLFLLSACGGDEAATPAALLCCDSSITEAPGQPAIFEVELENPTAAPATYDLSFSAGPPADGWKVSLCYGDLCLVDDGAVTIEGVALAAGETSLVEPKIIIPAEAQVGAQIEAQLTVSGAGVSDTVNLQLEIVAP